MERVKRHPEEPEEAELRMLNAASKWSDIKMAQGEVFLAQHEAYEAYPTEVDARRAGKAARERIEAATRPARAR
jgi:hypothetical protein